MKIARALVVLAALTCISATDAAARSGWVKVIVRAIEGGTVLGVTHMSTETAKRLCGTDISTTIECFLELDPPRITFGVQKIREEPKADDQKVSVRDLLNPQ